MPPTEVRNEPTRAHGVARAYAGLRRSPFVRQRIRRIFGARWGEAVVNGDPSFYGGGSRLVSGHSGACVRAIELLLRGAASLHERCVSSVQSGDSGHSSHQKMHGRRARSVEPGLRRHVRARPQPASRHAGRRTSAAIAVRRREAPASPFAGRASSRTLEPSATRQGRRIAGRRSARRWESRRRSSRR